MKVLKRFFIFLYAVLCIFVLLLSATALYYGSNIDNSYKITKGSDFVIETFIPVTAEYNGCLISNCQEANKVGNRLEVEVKLLGIIPIKNTTIEVVEESYVAVLGSPFGIKIYTNGVMIVDISDIKTSSGIKNPAKEAGIKKGDYILEINGEAVSTNEDIADFVTESKGEPLSVKIRRNEKIFSLMLTPVLSIEENIFRVGLWVKDSIAGLGMLTFYSPYNSMICGLGHAVYEENTEKIINVKKGELVGAEIVSVNRGVKGTPGELKGKFTYKSIGSLKSNLINGVYGVATCNVDTSNLTQIAHKQEVLSGSATIICTLDENGPRSYSCEIKVGSFAVNDTVQDMVVTITDNRLINKTGGIVQGMSGSPIVQNGKLIGAVTHVLVDNPTKGYAIFAENMLETAQSVANEQLKEAS